MQLPSDIYGLLLIDQSSSSPSLPPIATMDIASIIQPPNGSSREQVMNNISISKKFVADHFGANHQDVSFMIGTTAETVFLLLIFAACVVSNSLVFVIFYQKPTFRSLSNRFVLNLAVCDLLYSLLVIPNVMVSVISGGSAVGLWWCRITKVVTILLALSSAFSVVLIAVDRYCAVMNPLHYSMTITGARSSFMIAFIWSFALVLSILPMARLQDSSSQAILVQTLSPRSQEDDEQFSSAAEPRTVSSNLRDGGAQLSSSTVCHCWTTVTTLIVSYHRLWYSVTVVCLGFVLPLLILCWIYACMYRAAKQNNDRARRHSVTTNPSEFIYQHEALTGNCSMSSGECTPINTNSGGSLLQSGHMGGFKKTFCRRRSSNASLSIVFFREEGRAAQTGLLVIVTFAFCWFPYFAFIIFEAHPEWTGIPALSRILAQHLTFIGCALNPFVYVYRNRLVWKDARHVLHCSKRHNITFNNVNINNNSNSNNMNQGQRAKNGHLPIHSPLINQHLNANYDQQHTSTTIHRDFACLHSYPLTNNRLARSVLQARPKIVSAATDAGHHRLLYELPPPLKQLENIELASLRTGLVKEDKITQLTEPVVVISHVDETGVTTCSGTEIQTVVNPIANPPNGNLTIHLQPPIRIYNGSTLMDYLKVDSGGGVKPYNIGSSWSLPNQNVLHSDISTGDVIDFDVENGGSYVRVNRNLCKSSKAGNKSKSVGGSTTLEPIRRSCGIDRNRVYSKSAHFTRNLNNYNNDHNQYTMRELAVNRSNLVHIYNINNNHPPPPPPPLPPPSNKSATLTCVVGHRKRLSSAGSQYMARNNRRGHSKHASTNTLLDVVHQPDHIYQGTTI